MRRMLFLLVLGMAVLVCWGMAVADETAIGTFTVIKDTSVSGYPEPRRDEDADPMRRAPGDGEWYAGAGGWAVADGDSVIRLGNHNDISMYGWDMDAIKQWIADQNLPAGYYPVFEFSVVIATDAVDRGFPVSTITSLTDWTEGDGESFYEFAWSKDRSAATYAYAQTWYTDTDGIPHSGDEVLDEAKSVPWVRPSDSKEVHPRNLTPAFTNSERLWVTSGDIGKRVSVVLDYAFTQDMLNNPYNRGIMITGRYSYESSTNTTVYSREQSGGAKAARLTVSFTNVPVTYAWTAGTGTWSEPGNWNPPGPPPADTNALFSGHGGGTVTLDNDPAINDFKVGGNNVYEWTGGTLTLNGELDFNPTTNGAMDFFGNIAGPGHVHVRRGQLNLSGTNSYSGGTTVESGAQLHVYNSSALGVGPVVCRGTLSTNADNSLGSPTTGGAEFAAVVVETNGKLMLNSVETARWELRPGAVMDATDVGLGSTFDYDWEHGGNIKCHKGAIISGTVADLPGGTGVPDPSYLAPGDGIFGVWIGDVDQNLVVGDGGGTVFRGLACTQGELVFMHQVDETPGGTLGPMFLSTAGSKLIFDGAIVNADGENTIKLMGDGDFEFDMVGFSNEFNNPIEMLGSGRVVAYDDDALAGETLIVKNGVLDINAPAALRSATVIIEAGAAFQPRLVTSGWPIEDIGNLTIKAGGALDPHAAPLEWWWNRGDFQDKLAGFDYTLEPGAQILLKATDVPMDTTASGELPGAGIVNYIQYFSIHLANNIGDNVMRLGDETRLTTHSDGSVDQWEPELLAEAGYIGLAPDMTQCRITNQSGQGTGGYFSIYPKVDLTGSGSAAGTVGKLIIGDTNTFMAFGRKQMAFEEITQDGRVWLRNDSETDPNVIGSIDIVAGELRADTPYALGGAKEIAVATDAKLTLGASMTLNTMLKGGGQVDVSGTLTLEPTASVPAGVVPGNSAGKLDVVGDLSLNLGSGGENPTLEVEVVGTGTVAGVDYDQLAVDGVLSGLSNVKLTVSSSLSLGDVFGKEYVFVTCLNDVSGEQLAGVVRPAGWGGPVRYNFDVNTGGSLSMLFTLSGDATLDGKVGIADLGALADNYGVTAGATWEQGDFNDDGKVGIADLGALADNYGNTVGGAAAVPEPAGLALLALGGLALLRRRR